MRSRSKLSTVATFLLFFGLLGTAHGVPPGWVAPKTCSFECWFKGYVLTAYELSFYTADAVHPIIGSWGLSLEPRDAMEYAGASRRAHLLSKYPEGGRAPYARATLITNAVSSEDSYCDYQGHPIKRGPVWKVTYPSPWEIVRGEGGASSSICSEKEIGAVIARYNYGVPFEKQAPPCPFGAGGCRQDDLSEPDNETGMVPRGHVPAEFESWDHMNRKEIPGYFDFEVDTGTSEAAGDEDPKEPSSEGAKDAPFAGGYRPNVLEEREPQAQRDDAALRPVRAAAGRSPFCRSGKPVAVAGLHYPTASSCRETRGEVVSAVTGFHFRNACAAEHGGEVPERVRRVRVDRCQSADQVDGFDGGVVVEATVCCS